MANLLGIKRLRLQPDRRLAFFQEFLRHPQQVGSVIPSSRFLESRLVMLAGIGSARLAVELGPGTGGTTRAMLRALPATSRLLAVEVNSEFAASLALESDPRLIVHQGSAENIQAILAHHGLGAPDAVVSGIPFSTMPRELGRRIIAAIWSSLSPGGRFVAYQFRGHVQNMGVELIGPPQIQVELLNIPPVRIYCWHKAEDGS